jgi:hypothetical protein
LPDHKKLPDLCQVRASESEKHNKGGRKGISKISGAFLGDVVDKNVIVFGNRINCRHDEKTEGFEG